MEMEDDLLFVIDKVGDSSLKDKAHSFATSSKSTDCPTFSTNIPSRSVSHSNANNSNKRKNSSPNKKTTTFSDTRIPMHPSPMGLSIPDAQFSPSVITEPTSSTTSTSASKKRNSGRKEDDFISLKPNSIRKFENSTKSSRSRRVQQPPEAIIKEDSSSLESSNIESQYDAAGHFQHVFDSDEEATMQDYLANVSDSEQPSAMLQFASRSLFDNLNDVVVDDDDTFDGTGLDEVLARFNSIGMNEYRESKDGSDNSSEDEDSDYDADLFSGEPNTWDLDTDNRRKTSKEERLFNAIIDGKFDSDSNDDETSISKSQRRKIMRKEQKQNRQERRMRNVLRENQALETLTAVLGYRKPPANAKGRYKALAKAASRTSKASIAINPKVHAILVKTNNLLIKFVSDVESEAEEMVLPAMPAPLRNPVERIAARYELKCKVRGSGIDKSIVVIKHRKTFLPTNHLKIPDQIIKELKSKLDVDEPEFMESKKKGKPRKSQREQKKKRERKERADLLPGPGIPQVGTIVGEDADRIGSDNVGHRMLLAMGWKGGGVGADNVELETSRNTEPIEVVIRSKRKGLGAE